ncbi:MAG: tryptophan-rich sensory protein [Prochloraceae cyanobacterium]|nr:tryptophan-rich sensory protein [Prochloraceae cyanobacterium]
MKLDRNMLRVFANLFAIIASFTINVVANLNPIGGLTIGEISTNLFKDVLITPANYAFAIWGLIYLGLFSFAIYQALPSQRENLLLHRIGYLLVVSSAAQIIWVFCFLSRFFLLSLVAMLAILLPLIMVYLRLGIGKKRISGQDKWFIQIPLTIYLAWISVATIVNVAIVLYDLGWNGWGISPSIWTLIALLLAGAVAATISVVRFDTTFVLVFVWAIVAIAVRHLDKPIISITAGLLAIVLILFLVFSWRNRPKFLVSANQANGAN